MNLWLKAALPLVFRFKNALNAGISLGPCLEDGTLCATTADIKILVVSDFMVRIFAVLPDKSGCGPKRPLL